MSPPSPLTPAYLLAGGASSRFGRDKALVALAGKSLLARTLETISTVTPRIFVVAPPGKYDLPGATLIPDRWPGQGPLGGIITALFHAKTLSTTKDPTHSASEISPWNLVLSCDMPFLTSDFLHFIIDRAAQSKASVVLPRSTFALEPLCAAYRTSSADPLLASFASGVRKVTQALKTLPTEVLDDSQWKRFDISGRLFSNMNTPADFAEARKLLEQP